MQVAHVLIPPPPLHGVVSSLPQSQMAKMQMKYCSLSCLLIVLIVSSSMASAAVVEHTFLVEDFMAKPLCEKIMVPTVNGSLPGPVIDAREGDTIVVHVINKSSYNVTMHWHGVSKLSAWMDGVDMVTQCPIPTGQSFTYRFKVTGQEGTFMWHSHVVNLRTTLHGALIIRPRRGRPYPFPKPDKEVPVVLGQWWNTELEHLVDRPPPISDAYLINGLAGDTYDCSKNKMFKLEVVHGKRYLLRIVNAALNSFLFFKIGGHNLTVVAQDAVYTTPYVTDVIVLAPGQTADALLYDDKRSGSYYMATHPYTSAKGLPRPTNATRALVVYRGASTSSSPVMPQMPDMEDSETAHKFFSSVTSLIGGPHWTPPPRHVDEKIFTTMGLGLFACPPGQKCTGPYGQLYAGSFNNRSFVHPKTLPMQEAYYYNVSGVYTDDFPDQPPMKFDYTNFSVRGDDEYRMLFPELKTSARILKFNSTVEIVVQDVTLLAVESHPVHLHGFSFHVLGQGYGNYDPVRDATKLNLVNPQLRNTMAIPPGGWIVIRFVADNPGVWMFHCHMDAHMSYGMIMAFVVLNGPTPATSLPPPPSDLPQCSRNAEIYGHPTATIDSSS